MDQRVGSRTATLLSVAPIFFLGLVFFLTYVTLQTVPDDIAWLNGQPATELDRYRLLPLLVFRALRRLVGVSPAAALALAFCCHCVNAMLVAVLAERLGMGRTAARAAAVVVLINPVTLSTITWITSFSYVLGVHGFALFDLHTTFRNRLTGASRAASTRQSRAIWSLSDISSAHGTRTVVGWRWTPIAFGHFARGSQWTTRFARPASTASTALRAARRSVLCAARLGQARLRDAEWRCSGATTGFARSAA